MTKTLLLSRLCKSVAALRSCRAPLRSFRRYESSEAVPNAVPYQTVLKKRAVETPRSVPESADVVIIGGGIIGCSTLYHLTKLGCTNVVLLEKDNLTAGTTWHTAGLIWRLRPNDTDIQILNHTRHLLMNVLEEETGVYPGFINNGGLFIANSKERLDEYKRLMTIGKAFGIESHVLSPEETKKLYPLMNVEDLYGTLYSPGDGTVDPAGFCTSLVRASTAKGAKVIEKCSVLGVETRVDDFGTRRVSGVRTPFGLVRTNALVNCTGAWAPYIGEMAGVSVPLVAMKHAYVVTNRIEGIQGMPNVRDHDLSLYLRLQGDALSVGGYEPNPVFIDQLPKNFAFGLFDLDWDVFGTHIESGMHRVPVLEKTGIKSTVCGPESFTADHKPLLGEEPSLRGFFHGCGFNSLGMNGGGGCGRELAAWVLQGRPNLDMYAYDIRRFSPELTSNARWVRERSHESYVKNYSIVYPSDEPLASRNMRKDPLHEEMSKSGCVFQERLGWERPGWFAQDGPSPVLDYDYYGSYENEKHESDTYGDRLKMDYTFGFPKHHEIIKSECLGCRKGVAAFNMSYFGKFYMTGPDAQAAADFIFTNNMRKPEGSTVYTCMLNSRGMVEADLTVSAIHPSDGLACDPSFDGRGFYVAAAGASANHSLSHIRSVVQDRKFRVSIEDRSGSMGMLSVQGPKSRELLQSLTDADLSDTAFPFSTHKVIQFAGHKVRALRLTFVGELGWELHIPSSSCVPVYRALVEAGSKFGLINAGYRAIDSLSLEKGFRHWHADVRMEDTPLEAGLGFTCKLKSDVDFLGRRALEAQKAGGVTKRIACFTLDQHVALHGLEVIWRGDEVVGFTRRGDFGFAVGKSIAYGYVRRPDGAAVSPDYLASGDYWLESLGEKYKASFHPKPPLDPDNRRVKGVYDQPLPCDK
ncbi:sarcosine dehydrogenase, mitochondrial [Ixodes scapularis]|uniref:sarcosine dehydrogenase, mitochondrial n=1 Tax=Ixodes scapularis TaxID=6945 RepID=UPI001A9E0C49|nr:sarcosine dehydrogenase, mitochondrial [Ixodes scapularis]